LIISDIYASNATLTNAAGHCGFLAKQYVAVSAESRVLIVKNTWLRVLFLEIVRWHVKAGF
jgi:hypothetical protein